MVNSAQSPRLSVAEYLECTLASPIKHQLIGGEMRAKAGASGQHNRLAINFLITIDTHLKDKLCQPFTSDLKTKMVTTTTIQTLL